jgi:hypothetical protein
MDDKTIVERGRYVCVVIIPILDDTGHDEPPTRSTGRGNCLGCALVGVDATEEEQVFTPLRVEGKVFQADTVVDRRRIAKIRVAIGLADRDIVDAILIRLEDGQDALRGKPVNRRYDRCLHHP